MQTLSKNVIADFSTQLAVKMAIGATTGTLASATDSDGVALPTGTYFLTLDKNNSKKEYIKCTVTGTALTSIQSISRQGALTSGCVREHRVGANVIISDFASLSKINDLLTGATDFDASTPLKYDGTATINNDAQFTTKKYVDDSTVGISGDETVAGVKTFSSSPIVPTPTTDMQVATKKYADDLAIAGSPDASTTVKGIVEEATNAEIVAGTGAGATGARLFINPTQVATSGANKVLLTGADGLVSPSAVAPETISNLNRTSSSIPWVHSYSDSINGLCTICASGTTLTFHSTNITGGYQTRTITSDWADADSVTSAIVLGDYLYLMMLDGTTAYRVYRYDKTNLSAGGTLMTFSGQSLAYNSAEQRMTSNGTNFYFNHKAGNSANSYVVSKYTLSGTTLTYVSDITCGSTASDVQRFVSVDSSENIYGLNTSNRVVKKFNSSGTLQVTYGALPNYTGAINTTPYCLNTAPYLQNSFDDVYAQRLYLMNRFYI